MSRAAATSNIVIKITLPKRTGRKRKRGSDEPFLASEQYDTPALVASRSDSLLRTLRDNPNTYHVEPIGFNDEIHRFRSVSRIHCSLSLLRLITTSSS